jgi:predicted TIM-barrel fold metal-dependent hydrolase
MDEHYEWLGEAFGRELTMEPSAYFKQRCFVSVECDEDPIKSVHDLMGVGNVVFSTDFPHPDCKYPGAVARFLELPLPDDAKRAILWDNCARYYGLG